MDAGPLLHDGSLRTKKVRNNGVVHYNGAQLVGFEPTFSLKSTLYVAPHFGTLHANTEINGPHVAAAFFDCMKTGGNP